MGEGSRRPCAVVTGARQGIGRGFCRAMVASGFDVVAIGSLENSADETLSVIEVAGGPGNSLQADVADLAEQGELVERGFEAFDTVDSLVNNAGVTATRSGLLDYTPENYDRVMGVNLRGTFFLTQAVVHCMVAEDRPGTAPVRSIITVSSSNAYLAASERRAYCISKTALSMMTKLFALRLARCRTYSYEVRPGIIRTPMTAPFHKTYDRWIDDGLTPITDWGEPEHVGHTVATLAGNLMPFPTGDAFHVDGGLHVPCSNRLLKRT